MSGMGTFSKAIQSYTLAINLCTSIN